MPQELKSFLIWVSVIVVAAFMVPCIEMIVNIVRRNQQQRAPMDAPRLKPSKNLSREVA